jgi:hypothetical protein
MNHVLGGGHVVGLAPAHLIILDIILELFPNKG